MSALDNIVSLAVVTVDLTHDFLSLQFDDRTTLNIFNKYSYDGGDLSLLTGETVSSVVEEPHLLEVGFSKGGVLSIGLTNDDFVGPEAMVLKLNGGEIIVWP